MGYTIVYFCACTVGNCCIAVLLMVFTTPVIVDGFTPVNIVMSWWAYNNIFNSVK